MSFWVFGGQGIAVASMTPQALQPAGVTAAVRYSENLIGFGDPRGFICAAAESRVFSTDDTTRMARRVRGVVINSDRNRWLEYESPLFNLVPVDFAKINATMLEQFARPASVAAAEDARALLTTLCTRASQSDVQRAEATRPDRPPER